MNDKQDPIVYDVEASLAGGYTHRQDLGLWVCADGSRDFSYSDGDASEDYVLHVIQNAVDRSVNSDELYHAIRDWPSSYHLHHERCNLLRPFLGEITGPVLEIGAGTGILTRLMGEHGFEVVALEGSQRRAKTIVARCDGLRNVTIVNANLDDFRPSALFGTITLIGVLEYARVHYGDPSNGDPVDQMLRHAASMLVPGGKLIVAIENQIGLKYLAGFPEDHLGYPMAGVESHYSPTSIVTFGRRDLRERLVKAGLTAQEWCFPYPDYKFPRTIVFEAGASFPEASMLAPLIGSASEQDRQRPRDVSFSLSRAQEVVARNGLAGDLANSFLVFASRQGPTLPRRSLAIHFGNGDLRPEFLKQVDFVPTGEHVLVQRKKLLEEAEGPSTSHRHVLADEEFFRGDDWGARLKDIVLKEGWSTADLLSWLKPWEEALRVHAGVDANGSTTVPGALFDAIPRNLVVAVDGTAQFFDLEWQSDHPIDMRFMVFRAVWDSLFSIGFCRRPIRGTPTRVGELSRRLMSDIAETRISSDQLHQYWRQEIGFQNQVARVPTPEQAWGELYRRPLPIQQRANLRAPHNPVPMVRRTLRALRRATR